MANSVFPFLGTDGLLELPPDVKCTAIKICSCLGSLCSGTLPEKKMPVNWQFISNDVAGG